MDKSMSNQLEKIDEARLRPFVRQVLQRDTAEILNWNRQQLKGGLGGGLGGTAIYLFEGQAQAGGQQMPWSLILKVMEARMGEEADSSHYWKREVEVYRSGWLDSLPGPLIAPRCFGVEEHADEGCWLWLEYLTDSIKGTWPLAQYKVVANHLGQFNGAYIGQPSPPSWPWLSSNLIRGDLQQAAPGLTILRHSLTHPLVRRLLPGDSSDRFFQLYDQRETYFKWLEKLPQVLCHFDAFRLNLFARHTQDGLEETVAIDWALLGPGPIGAEIVALVWITLLGDVEPAMAHELDNIVFEGYLEGLRATGWRGDPKQIRLAYTTALALRRIGSLGYGAMILADYIQEPEVSKLPDSDTLEFLDVVANVGSFAEDLAKEAGQLAESVL